MNLLSLQKPSRYINHELNTVYKEAPVKVALAFPDIYEIGMSHLGLKILYDIVNKLPYASAERVFSPWIDLEAEMRAEGILLASLESKRPLRDFDIVGFSLQYDLSYTTVLNMLHLGGLPVRAEDRDFTSFEDRLPLIIAGGPCTVNPFPMSPFIDAFLVGDGEDAITEILTLFSQWKAEGDGKKASLLAALSEIEGIFVPGSSSDFSIPDTFRSKPVKRRFIKSLEDAPYPEKPIVPYMSIVHDRINIEVSRGCSMGCRFCQAGMIYRPVRERSPSRALQLAEKSLKNTGYEEVSFTSLSAGDYSCLLQVVRSFNERFSKDRIALSLPSLRVASINHDLLREIRSVRKTGFTIAPEAATERLRRVINKDFSEADYELALKTLFEEGWLNLKLYFMIGLPTETEEDIHAIPHMAMKALKTAKQFTRRFVNINVGISPFVPKAHTPFQWYGQRPAEELAGKKQYITDMLTRKGFHIKGHNIKMSFLEAAFSRGDERIAPLIEKAWSLGCRLDGWTEVFNYEKWTKAMELTGINAGDFAAKTFHCEEPLPWERIETGVSKDFLWKEYQRALSEEFTTDCRQVCHQCGLGCHKDTETGRRGDGEAATPAEELKVSPGRSFSASPRFKPVRIRVEFSKTGRLRYLSHLELVVLLQRALRRAEVPVEYSKGFHPYPKTSFGPPLGVGIAGLSEYFDMEIIPPCDLSLKTSQMNALLPEGVQIKDMVFVPAKAESLSSFITRYEYTVTGCDVSRIRSFLSEKEIPAERDNRIINVRSMVEEARSSEENTAIVILNDQGEIKIRLHEILPALFQVPLQQLDITRVALYGWNGGWVKPLERSEQWIAKF